MVLSSFQLALWSLVKPYYVTPHRFYHTMDHIDAMLCGYEKFFGNIPIEDYFAVAYHDAQLKPWSKTNEEDSVKLMYVHHQLYYPNVKMETLKKAEVRIMATKHGHMEVPLSAYKIVDLDLMILGKEPQVYDEYVANTRREYSMYDDDEWRQGRSKVLEGFLNMPRLFHTDELHQVFDQPARENIMRELVSLEECVMT